VKLRQVMSVNKEEQIGKIKLKRYRVYGIFDFQSELLVYVGLSMESVQLEYDIEEYDEERYDIVSFDVLLH
jgi:hypothetical protein